MKKIFALFGSLLGTNKKHGRALQGLATGLAIGIVVALLHLAGATDKMEMSLADMRRINFTGGTPGTNVIHVNVTQRCLDSMKENSTTWPWQREAWAIITDWLGQSGARAVVFDLLFTEFSSYGVDDDRKLVSAVSNAGNVVFCAQFSTPLPRGARGEAAIASNRAAQTAKAAGLAPFSIKLDMATPDAPLMRYQFLDAFPYEEYLPHLAGLGNVYLQNDSDSIARRKRLVFDHYGRGFLDLSLAAIARSLGLREARIAPGEIRFLAAGGREITVPVDAKGSLPLKFYGPFRKIYNRENHNFFPAYDLLSGILNPDQAADVGVKPEYFRNKIVIIGTDAPGLKDIRPNPFSNSDGGAYLYSTAIENILGGDFIRESYSPELTILLILVFSMLTGYAGGRLSVIRGVLVSLAIALVYSAFAIALFAGQSVLVEMAAVLIGIGLTFVAGAVRNYFVESRQKHFIQGAFSQILAPAILEKLINDPASLTLGGDSKELTIFFSDLQGFTTLSEALGSAQKLVEILNEYLTAMADVIIMDYDGYVDKYEGDAIMAFWGAPVDDPGHAWKACHAALDNQTRLAELQQRFIEKGLPGGLAVRIGLNTGIAVAGMMGSMKKLNYTIIGDPVNLASRLEGANKQYGTKVMISEATRLAAGDRIVSRPLDLIRVKGKTEPTAVFELMAKGGQATQQQMELAGVFEQALGAYRNCDFATALKGLETALRIKPDDGPSLVYIDRCRQFVVNPPPRPWDGVFTMTSK